MPGRGRFPAEGRNVSVDPRNQPVAGVEVTAPGFRTLRTGHDGQFALQRVAPSDRFAISFRARDFMDTTRIFSGNDAARGNVIIIWPRAATATLHAERGGKAAFPAGTVEFPPRAFVDERGRATRIRSLRRRHARPEGAARVQTACHCAIARSSEVAAHCAERGRPVQLRSKQGTLVLIDLSQFSGQITTTNDPRCASSIVIAGRDRAWQAFRSRRWERMTPA